MKINIDNKGIWFSNDGSSTTDFNIDHNKVNFNNDIGFCTGGGFDSAPSAYTAGLTMALGSSLHWIRTGVGPAPRKGDIISFKIRFVGTRSVMGSGQFEFNLPTPPSGTMLISQYHETNNTAFSYHGSGLSAVPGDTTGVRYMTIPPNFDQWISTMVEGTYIAASGSL
jgi:hypothetical protein